MTAVGPPPWATRILRKPVPDMSRLCSPRGYIPVGPQTRAVEAQHRGATVLPDRGKIQVGIAQYHPRAVPRAAFLRMIEDVQEENLVDPQGFLEQPEG